MRKFRFCLWGSEDSNLVVLVCSDFFSPKAASLVRLSEVEWLLNLLRILFRLCNQTFGKAILHLNTFTACEIFYRLVLTFISLIGDQESQINTYLAQLNLLFLLQKPICKQIPRTLQIPCARFCRSQLFDFSPSFYSARNRFLYDTSKRS